MNKYYTVGKILSVVKSVDGTKENSECSNRGICDTSNGVCTCSNNFDTSDGYNDIGMYVSSVFVFF
jgi:hypothetical protein